MVLLRQKPRAFTRPKELERPCEDFILGCSTHGRYAISDGASISYDSRGWARILCRQFLSNTNVGPDWLDAARRCYADLSAPPADDWAASHAYERGSYATFLGLTVTDARVVAYAVGDTVLFILTPDKPIAMFPRMGPSDFERDPVLLCSRAGQGAFADTDEAFSDAQFIEEAPAGGWSGTRLIAVTDALAEWVVRSETLDEQSKRLVEIVDLRDWRSFRAWAETAIAVGRIRRDDCAALVISL